MINDDPSGIIIIDKPKGLTSHDVVDIVRRVFRMKRVGHAGTLDPIATGVLVILLGRATKRSNMLSGADKEYSAMLKLGVSTDSADAYGKVTKTSRLNSLDAESVEKAVLSFKGEIEQVPPMFSAVKYKGKRLYKLARKGVTVERKARKVTIKNISISEIGLPDVSLDVVCTKGTYIRQLCADIGEKLGCGAHMTELRRTRSGDFNISEAVSIDSLKKASGSGGEPAKLLI
ncbi:MAG: tRNA pseudouridine(55) synthase TruB [Candidatus Omnitrophica bacterium]|nr:tRNA pseudouridine(55) synthase TruB [Candidatus Omnitrophota bacterium]